MANPATLRRLSSFSSQFVRRPSVHHPRPNFAAISKLYSTSPDEVSAPPLTGLKVVDLTRVLAGPFCTQILADYGADVIKVEQPKIGDESRHWKGKAETGKWKADGPISYYFTGVNRNKRSITLDLKKRKALEVLFGLVKNADVFVENLIPGKAEELGFGYKELSKINPKLVYASISGYGPTGPHAKRAGYDAIAAAEGGLMHITGFPGAKPVRPGVGMVDMATGLYMHGAILAALQSRAQTGRGQHITASLFETQISLLINIGVNWLNLGLEGQRVGSAHPSISPYDVFEAKGGQWFAVGANNERQYKILCERLGRMDLLEDPRFKTNAIRVENRKILDGIVNDIIKTKTVDEWMIALEGSGLAHGAVNSIERAFNHPQIEARGMVETLPVKEVESGEIKHIGMPVKFSETKGQIRTRAPLLGEHTAEVLREMGYEEGEIEMMRKEEVT
ncbi:CoA-transferase family III [Lepidopterella palustris CBS 459.81]|uniref:CoA-transferase family III n=1 Tax=Lepidopterella palustris CBS 459.81 TaxID=1314670 RepID=A0A8E2E9I5_9PEZI|nr:CoA-transferase family III [Lepidopterella palustris CBS 459.81]